MKGADGIHIVGDVMQAVVIPLRGGQEVQAEPGARLYMAGDVEILGGD
jgi:uncharacterized protein (AIM24 family)